MDRVCNDHEPLIITRNGEQQAVVMRSLEDDKGLEEIAYLLRSPANAQRLQAATAQLNAGQGQPRALVE